MQSIGSIPFTAYDFLAYLAEGFVMLLSIDAAFVSDPTLFSPTALETLILVAAAFTVGQLVDQLAGGLMETVLFDKTTVGFPSVNLFVERRSGGGVWRPVFGAYWRPFAAPIRARILARTHGTLVLEAIPGHKHWPARIRRNKHSPVWKALAAEGEALYDHCYGALKARGSDSGGLATLVNVYTFCRNMSAALALGAAALTVGALRDSAHTGAAIPSGWWAAGAAFTAGGLFLRYLKIYRLFHEEIFTTYAALDPPDR